MEVKEKSKKRELIKTIAIIFLTVLLVLTFFSSRYTNGLNQWAHTTICISHL